MKKPRKSKNGRPAKGYVRFKWFTDPDVLKECRQEAAKAPCGVSDKITALVKRGLEAEKGKAA